MPWSCWIILSRAFGCYAVIASSEQYHWYNKRKLVYFFLAFSYFISILSVSFSFKRFFVNHQDSLEEYGFIDDEYRNKKNSDYKILAIVLISLPMLFCSYKYY